MAKSKLTVYCDVVSPFAYMAFYITQVSAGFLSIASHNRPHSPTGFFCSPRASNSFKFR